MIVIKTGRVLWRSNGQSRWLLSLMNVSISRGNSNCDSQPANQEQNNRPSERSSFIPAAGFKHDWIGPSDRLSNIRPVIYHIPANETPLERRLRHLRQETEDWNHHFWANQNVSFSKFAGQMGAMSNVETLKQLVKLMASSGRINIPRFSTNTSSWKNTVFKILMCLWTRLKRGRGDPDNTKEKEDFIQSRLDANGLSTRDENGRKRTLSSEEMAVFYKHFLDENRVKHANYNKEWYRRNFTITFLMGKVFLVKVWKKMAGRWRKAHRA